MYAVLLSIKPKWCELIPNGKKTVEVRKTKPKIDVPFKCYIYCTKTKGNEKPLLCTTNCIDWENIDLNAKVTPPYIANGKVIGEFVCDRITKIINHNTSFIAENKDEALTNEIAYASCLDFEDMKNYLVNKDGYAWHISNLVIYDKPKELGDFKPLTCDYNADNECINKNKCKHQETTMCWGYITKRCNKQITRPPMGWMFVEEMGV